MLEGLATARGLGYLSLHYTGHGQGTPYPSSPNAVRVQDVTSLQTWCDDIMDVLSAHRELLLSVDQNKKSRLVLVGASLGGWLALLVLVATWHGKNRTLAQMVDGVVLVAPAIDASVRWGRHSRESLKQGTQSNVVSVPSAYLDTPDTHIFLHKDLVTDANKRFLLLESSLCHSKLKEEPLSLPVRILYGTRDDVISVENLVSISTSKLLPNATLERIEGGDHRLSDEYSLSRIRHAVFAFLENDL